MRKTLVIFSLLMISFLFVSCDNNSTTTQTDTQTTSLQTTTTILTDTTQTTQITTTSDIVQTNLQDYLEPGESYELVWAEEFDYEGMLDSDNWTYLIGNGQDYGIPGWGNGELQYYTDRLENVYVQDGRLTIKASTDGIAGYGYSSGRVVTKNHADFTYGVFEVSAKMPTGLGTWPAIWMLPTNSPYGGWPYGGEIDIMEAVGFETDTVHWNIHTKAHNWGDNRSVGDHGYIPNIATEFHRYGIKWLEDQIMFYVDGVHQFTYTPEDLNDSNYWPFDSDFHFILNIAVGGSWGGQQGIQEGTWETTMEVDYVRVYQK